MQLIEQLVILGSLIAFVSKFIKGSQAYFVIETLRNKSMWMWGFDSLLILITSSLLIKLLFWKIIALEKGKEHQVLN